MKLRGLSLRVGGLCGLLALSLLTAPTASAQKATRGGGISLDRAARGVDLWVQADASARSGEPLLLNLVVLGYPTATTLVPLENATVEAAWEPASLLEEEMEPATVTIPSPVSGKSGAGGGLTLAVPVPMGPPKQLKLLLRVAVEGHERTISLTVERSSPSEVDLFVSDRAVVPGSELMAWAVFSGKQARKPDRSIEFVLTQGGVVRARAVSKTDASGTASAKLTVPRDAGDAASFTLEARPLDRSSVGASTTLKAREEVPGQPSLRAFFEQSSALAGGEISYRARVRDASGEPLRAQEVWVWSGPRGTAPPEDDVAFRRIATRKLSDENGEVTGTVSTPSTVPRRGTEQSLHVRTELEGRMQSDDDRIAVGQARGRVVLSPEAGALIPGLKQKVVLELSDGRGAPLLGEFRVRGDKLDQRVTTNSHGELEFDWDVPVGIGAARNIGPCPGQVAAAVSVQALLQPQSEGAPRQALELLGTDGETACVPVQRAGKLIVRPAKLIVEEGERLPISLLGASSPLTSLLLRDQDGGSVAASFWREGQGTMGLDIPLGAEGPMDVVVSVPTTSGASPAASARILVLPKQLPALTGQISSGKAAPSSFVTIDAELKDNHGRPLIGTVAAIVVDKYGGADLEPLLRLDTKRRLCSNFREAPERCDELLGGGPDSEPLRRARLQSQANVEPRLDPAKDAAAQFQSTFSSVVRSMEAAVLESSMSRETLTTLRKSSLGRSAFPSELMAAALSSLPEPALTPGGEALTLNDLTALDPQVSYDRVAQRVTRLKLFDILAAMHEERIHPTSEEAISDPNALLRKLVRGGALSEGSLLDPWGGSLSFQPSRDPFSPFVSFKRGFALHSPGPDGKVGNADDLRSPFQRVLQVGTPYAKAGLEEELVDAGFDLLAADQTVQHWKQTFDRATGTSLGGLALHGIGEGGGGRGEGMGLGGLGTIGHGSGRGTGTSGITFMSEPVQTDENGRARVRVQLGPEETTWKIALIGLPFEAGAAVTTLELPVNLELSSKVIAGTIMTEGDQVTARVQLRNRSERELRVDLEVQALGALSLRPGGKPQKAVVPAKSAVLVDVPVLAGAAGEGQLVVKVSADGLASDTVRHTLVIQPAGREMNITRAAWVASERTLSELLDKPNFDKRGPASLRLFHGLAPQLERIAQDLENSASASLEELADIVDSCTRLEAYLRDKKNQRLADRLHEIGQAARARLLAGAEPRASVYFSLRGRIAGSSSETEVEPLCPAKDATLDAGQLAAALDAEPTPKSGAGLQCFTDLAARAVSELSEGGQAEDLARAVVALASRPHRANELAPLRTKLLERVRPSADGRLALPTANRATRTLVYAALLLSAEPNTDADTLRRYFVWLLVQRDGQGGFGSAAATRAALLAMLAREAEPTRAATVSVDFGAAGERELVLQPGAMLALEVPAGADELTVKSDQPLLSEVSRNYLRPFARAASEEKSSLRMELRMPQSPVGSAQQGLRRGDIGNLLVTLTDRESQGQDSRVAATIPLPPGVELASEVTGVRPIPGALQLSIVVSGGERELTIPLRFKLAGSFTLREAEVRRVDSQQTSSLTRARTLRVEE